MSAPSYVKEVSCSNLAGYRQDESEIVRTPDRSQHSSKHRDATRDLFGTDLPIVIENEVVWVQRRVEIVCHVVQVDSVVASVAKGIGM